MSSPDSNNEAVSTFWPKSAIDWLELTFKILMIVGSIGAVYQYFDIKQENRVKETMEFVDNFNSGDLQSAKNKINDSWEEHDHAEFKKLEEHGFSSEAARVKFLTKFVITKVTSDKLEKEINLYINFFDNLKICVENNICDIHTAKEFFSEDATSFFDLYEPWIKHRRETVPNYACQFQVFVKQEKCS